LIPKFDYKTDVLIVGAGPAGASTSIFLAKEKISHIIIDKASFPRDKICGDALSAKTVGMLKRITPNWQQHFLVDSTKAIVSSGIQFIASNNTCLDIPFQLKDIDPNDPPGFVSKRLHFDNNLVELIDANFAHFFTHTTLENIEEVEDGLKITINKNGTIATILTKMIVGAEGRGSMVAKKLAAHKVEQKHYSAGIRGYYKSVTGLHQQNFIELHFLTSMQPGYFWIFPLPNGEANVGMGMLSSAVANKKANLKNLLQEAISSHPTLKERFKNATLQSSMDGWGLPLGSKKRHLSGDRFLLVGDAGSLIDPFTGEGIGNAMVSGLVAARQIKIAIDSNNFTADNLKGYDTALYKKLWAELKLSHYLQILTSKPWLFNFVINKASKSKELRETISCMFENVDIRKKFASPLFYLRILFNK
jgi:menaquinone-9 beta-reductase